MSQYTTDTLLTRIIHAVGEAQMSIMYTRSGGFTVLAKVGACVISTRNSYATLSAALWDVYKQISKEEIHGHDE